MKFKSTKQLVDYLFERVEMQNLHEGIEIEDKYFPEAGEPFDPKKQGIVVLTQDLWDVDDKTLRTTAQNLLNALQARVDQRKKMDAQYPNIKPMPVPDKNPISDYTIYLGNKMDTPTSVTNQTPRLLQQKANTTAEELALSLQAKRDTIKRGSEQQASPAQQKANIVESKFDLNRWQKMAGILKE